MSGRIIVGIFVFSVLFLNSCTKNEEPNDLVDIIAIISMPTSTEESAESTQAAEGYESMPQGIPIVVDVDRSPVGKDPLDKGPFVNITKTIAHLGFRENPDSLWGEWVFDSVTGDWRKVQYSEDSSITLKWTEDNTQFTLNASKFILDAQGNIIHAMFNLFTSDTNLIAWLGVDTIGYYNNMPVYAKYTYSILDFVEVTVRANAIEGHHLREPHLFGTVEGIVNVFNDDTIYTFVNNQRDLSQEVDVFFRRRLATYRKSMDISSPDSTGDYKFRDISGVVLRETDNSTDTIGILEGRIWYPQDASHRNYLDVILSETGERIHLWN